MSGVIDTRWVSYYSIAYLSGKGVVWGVGNTSPLPQLAKDVGQYGIVVDDRKLQSSVIVDSDYSILSDKGCDFVFVGYHIADIQNPESVLKALLPKLRDNGHMVLHVPAQAREWVREWLSRNGAWVVKGDLTLNDHTCLIVKRLLSGKFGLRERAVSQRKRVCISRFGAIGDAIMITPLLRELWEDGYEVTLNITPYAAAVFENNPYVTNVIVQQRDAIPNPDLGAYWDFWAKHYDRYINLSESIEASLLKVEWRPDFYTPRLQRDTNVNYYQHTLELGGYTGVKEELWGELFITTHEEEEARNALKKLGVDPAIHTIVLLGLSGTSNHKIIPLAPMIMGEWLPSTKNVRVVLMGDASAQPHTFEMEKVVSLVGRLSVRGMLALTKIANIVIGPESALVNAAACWPSCKKVVFLSHSRPENLTATWKRVWNVTPNSACYPCHQIHHSKESCPLVQIVDPTTDEVIGDVPVCTVAYEVKEVVNLLDTVLAA